jgi:hypothetical protein
MEFKQFGFLFASSITLNEGRFSDREMNVFFQEIDGCICLINLGSFSLFSLAVLSFLMLSLEIELIFTLIVTWSLPKLQSKF